MFGWVINIFRAARSNLKILDSYVNKDIRKIINVSLSKVEMYGVPGLQAA